MDNQVLATALVIAGLLALLGSGLWIFASMLLVSMIGLYLLKDYSLIRIGAMMQSVQWRTMTSFELAALPLFVWMGEILFRTRLSEQIFRGMAPWVNWLPGRLLHVVVLACGVFGSVSGSSAATCATISKIALPELKRRGYERVAHYRFPLRRRHTRHSDPALHHHGAVRGRGRGLAHQADDRGVPAGLPDDGPVLGLYHRLEPVATASHAGAGRNPAAPRALRASAGARPARCAARVRVRRAVRGLDHRHRMRCLGGARINPGRPPVPRLQLGGLLGQRARDRPHELHDHHPDRGRRLHVLLHGSGRHPEGGGGRDRKPRAQPLRPDRAPDASSTWCSASSSTGCR